MPTKQSPTKGTAHSTPTKAKKPASDQVTPIREAKGKGFFKPEATAMVREVLTNEPSDAKAAARLGVNRSTAYRLRKRLEKDLPLITPQVRTPPPSPDTQKRVQILKDLIDEHEACTCPELRDMLEHEHGIVVTRMTVYRDVTEKLGLEFKLARAVPAKFDEEKRVAFAEEELKKDPDAVYYVFMDESWINATHRNKGRWVEQGAPRPDLKCRERHVPKVNTFALLCEDRLMCWDLPEGQGKKGGVTQAQFHAFFKKHVGPQLANLKKWAKNREVRLMLDGAATHGVKKLNAWAQNRGISLIQGWPSHSPDLNPIENMFSRLKDGIGKELQIYSMANKEHSKKRIAAKRNKVAKALAGKCAPYVKSFHTRLQVCVEKKGSHTGY